MSVVVDLPLDIEKMLVAIANESNKSKENLIKDIILEYLEDLAKDAKLGEKAYKEYLANGRESISAKEVFERLGI